MQSRLEKIIIVHVQSVQCKTLRLSPCHLGRAGWRTQGSAGYCQAEQGWLVHQTQRTLKVRFGGIICIITAGCVSQGRALFLLQQSFQWLIASSLARIRGAALDQRFIYINSFTLICSHLTAFHCMQARSTNSLVRRSIITINGPQRPLCRGRPQVRALLRHWDGHVTLNCPVALALRHTPPTDSSQQSTPTGAHWKV